MRIIIKGADFSSVSAGRVGEDLSFTIDSTNYLTMLANPPSGDLPKNAGEGYNDPTTFYQGSVGDQTYTVKANNANRFTTDYIEVVPGMTISASNWAAGGVLGTIPAVVCFDENKNPMVPISAANAGYVNSSNVLSGFTIPSGCKYIILQLNTMTSTSSASGTMPA